MFVQVYVCMGLCKCVCVCVCMYVFMLVCKSVYGKVNKCGYELWFIVWTPKLYCIVDLAVCIKNLFNCSNIKS